MRTTVPHPRPAPRERSRPASFCPAPVASAFAPPAPVSAAPAVPPSPPLLPSSSSLSRTPDKVRVRTVRAAVPHPHPAPREWSRPGIFLPGSCRFSLRPSGPRFRRSPTPAVLPSSPLLPSSSSLSRTPDKVRVCTVHAAVPHPRPAPRERSRPTSFCPAFAPTAPGPCRSPAPTVPPSSPLRTFVSQPHPHAGQSSDSFYAHYRSASPPGTPGTVPPDIFLPGLRPSGSRFRRFPAPTVPPSSPLRTFVSQPHPHAGQSSDSFYAHYRSASPPGTPGTVPPDIFLPGLRPSGSRFRRFPAPTVPPSSPLRTFVSQPLPHAGQSSVPFCTRCRSASPPESRERSRPASFCPAPVAPPLPAATGRTGCSFGPAREKGCLTDLRQPRFYPYCYSGTSPNTQFSENWKNSSDGPLHSYSRSRTSPPPPNMPLKGSKNLPDSSVRSRIAQPADRLPAPAAARLSSSSHRSSGSPDR